MATVRGPVSCIFFNRSVRKKAAVLNQVIFLILERFALFLPLTLI